MKRTSAFVPEELERDPYGHARTTREARGSRGREALAPVTGLPEVAYLPHLEFVPCVTPLPRPQVARTRPPTR